MLRSVSSLLISNPILTTLILYYYSSYEKQQWQPQRKEGNTETQDSEFGSKS